MMLSCEVSSGGSGISDEPETPVDINYQFTTTVTYLEAGTDGTCGTKATYCYFGDWPQTIKEDGVTVSKNQTITMGGATYYAGSDGNWYAKCTENAYSADYTYSNGTKVNQIGSKKTKYFKVEPIKWRVLNPGDKKGNKLLLAEKVIISDMPYYDYGTVNRSINGTTVYSNNYMHSKVRAYLNGLSYEIKESDDAEQVTNSDYLDKGFFQTAFTESAQKMIADTKVDNSAVSTNPAENPKALNEGKNQYVCENTLDKVFLLSNKEVTTTNYGFAKSDVYIGDKNGTKESTRIRKSTDFALANFVECNTKSDLFGSPWFKRSPYHWSRVCALAVTGIGSSTYTWSVSQNFYGIVPALSISAK